MFQALRGSSLPAVTITVRFTYFLNEWSDSVWPQAPPDVDSCLGDEVGLKDMATLPFGTGQDAIRLSSLFRIFRSCFVNTQHALRELHRKIGIQNPPSRVSSYRSFCIATPRTISTQNLNTEVFYSCQYWWDDRSIFYSIYFQ